MALLLARMRGGNASGPRRLLAALGQRSC